MGQTPVEWLENGINKVLSHLPIEREEIKKLIEQVKEMEKERLEYLKDFDTWKEWKNSK